MEKARKRRRRRLERKGEGEGNGGGGAMEKLEEKVNEKKIMKNVKEKRVKSWMFQPTLALGRQTSDCHAG
jgi:hypothetical protein